MKAVYISGPYSSPTDHGRQRNLNAAWELATEVWAIQGLYAVCPHLNTMHMDGVFSEDRTEDYHNFLAADVDLLRRCDAVLMMEGWERSTGANLELKSANILGIPVFFRVGDLRDLAAEIKSPGGCKPACGCDSVMCGGVIQVGPVS